MVNYFFPISITIKSLQAVKILEQRQRKGCVGTHAFTEDAPDLSGMG